MKQEKSSIKGRTTGDKRTEIIIKDIERRIINKEMFSLAGFEVANMKFIKRYLNCRNDRENALYVAGMLEEYFNGFEIFLVSEDEIVVLMSGVDSKAAYERSLKFLDILSEPVLLCGIPVNVDITCGIVEYQQGSGTAEKLYGRLSKAILAAYDNKERICIYSEEMSGLLRKQLYNRVRMYNAILMNKLKLEYQPKFSLAKNRITGAEALIRWEESGMDAAEIIEAAENADMMTHLTKWVARESIKQLGRWKKEGIDTTISINVTKLDLMDSSLLEYMVSCLEDCKVDAGRIDLEIKDSLYL